MIIECFKNSSEYLIGKSLTKLPNFTYKEGFSTFKYYYSEETNSLGINIRKKEFLSQVLKVPKKSDHNKEHYSGCPLLHKKYKKGDTKHNGITIYFLELVKLICDVVILEEENKKNLT